MQCKQSLSSHAILQTQCPTSQGHPPMHVHTHTHTHTIYLSTYTLPACLQLQLQPITIYTQLASFTYRKHPDRQDQRQRQRCRQEAGRALHSPTPAETKVMAQLPPRAPGGAAPQDHWSAAGEFLGFAAARRGAHRRSASDSAAFLEALPMEDVIGGDGFDRLDDDQLMSMFSDVDAPAVSAGDAAQLMDVADADADDDGSAASSRAAADGVAADPKRVKRILANRQSAQRSRVRKLQYISELERSVTGLQMEVSALSPRVAFLDHQRSLLTVGNSHLKQRIAALAQDKIFKDAHQEALKKEIERLRHVYQQQQMKVATTGGADIAAAASMQARQELLACEGAAIR
ncbi:Basic leucine zipper 19 [Zea mays]|uniref:Basic leucine zipper 19 n=1 Tax=Zea mays TaxID=4577 RepID=A0A3L6EQX3_MAIZE|nr:Basic leucine zipper 19 [Zea mays]